MKKKRLILGCICAGCVFITNPGYAFAAESVGNMPQDTASGENLKENVVPENESDITAGETPVGENHFSGDSSTQEESGSTSDSPKNADLQEEVSVTDRQTSTVPTETIQANTALDGWVEESDGMHYYINGTEIVNRGYKIEDKWYYFNEDGVSMRNWFRQKGTDRFYYDENGWLVANTELDINGKHYKFLSSGAAYKGWNNTSSGTYYYTEDGSRAAGEGLKINGYWYYFESDGQMLTGWREKEGGYYYYDEQGHLLSGLGIKIDNKWYYLTSSGRRLQNEFRQKGTDRFYYDENGWLVKNIELDINGEHFKFLSSGAAYKGWDNTSSGTYYYTEDGSRAIEEGVKIGSYWYYFDSTGSLMTDWWRTKDGGKYYYQSDGRLAVNIGLKIDGYWYYFSSSGKMLTGWRQKGSDWYYYDSNGHLVSDCTMTIGGYKYAFNSSGRMLASTWYNGEYYGSDGRQTTPPSGVASYTIELPGGNTTTVVGQIDTAASQQIFNMLNQYRVQNGLAPLKQANSQLQAAANIRACELAYLYSHDRPNGQSCFSVYPHSNAENIAYGYGYGGFVFSPELAMYGWMNSPGHNANMLNTSSTTVGISAFTQTIGGITYTYYVQLFALY